MMERHDYMHIQGTGIEGMREHAGSRVAAGERPVERRGMGGLALAAVFVILALSMAYFVTHFSAYFVFAAMIALFLGMVFSRNLQQGMFLYLCIAALAFGESPKVSSSTGHYAAGVMPSQVMLGFIAALWLGRKLFLREREGLVFSRLNLPLILLGVSSVISFAVANTLNPPPGMDIHQKLITQVAEMGLLFCSIFAFILSANLFRDKRWINLSVIPIALFGLYTAWWSITDFAMPVPVLWPTLLLSISAAVVYARLLFNYPHGIKGVILLSAFIFMLVGIAVDSTWASGIVATMVMLMVISAYKSKLLAAGIVAAVLVVLFVYPGVFLPMVVEARNSGDFDRFIIWRDALNMLMHVNPVTGVGPGNYYAYIYDYSTVWYGINTYTTAHNNYVQYAAELGIIGITLLLWAVAAGIRTGVDNVRRASLEMKWFCIAGTGIFAGIAVAAVLGDYLLPNRANNGILTFGTAVYTWIILGAGVAAANMKEDSVGEKDERLVHSNSKLEHK
jgi:hypothetical protein